MCYNNSAYWLMIFSFSNCFNDCRYALTENMVVSTYKNMTLPEVRIDQGIVRGVNMASYHKRAYFGFKGIPFAQPPVGNLRFKGPVPADPWNGILDASRESNRCPQLEGNAIVGDEDCLYLNVYTPRLPLFQNSSKLLPVMFFVYGGGFKGGSINSTLLNPEYILDKDVVLIVPSYRLGILGYLSTGDEVSPGNYGLKDLLCALEWNRDNIQYFGGDPNQVTIFGGSAGAISVDILTLSNLTNGLFNRHITQSGSALSLFAIRPRRTYANLATELGKYLGCPTVSSTVLVNCLRYFNVSQLLNTSSVFYKWKIFPQYIWGPTIEPKIEGALLTDHPTNLLSTGNVRDLPRIFSVTRDEGILLGGLFYEKPDLFQELLDKVDLVLPFVLQYDMLVENVTAYTTALKSYYLNDLTADRSLLLANFTQLIGDAICIYPAYSGLQQQLVSAKSPQYLCSFEYQGNLSHSYMFNGGSLNNWGVSHGDEILYLLPGPKELYGPPGYEASKIDHDVIDTMVQLWTSFAINGAPLISDLNNTEVWESYSSHNNYLQIGNGPGPALKMKHDFFENRMRFWKELHAATSWC